MEKYSDRYWNAGDLVGAPVEHYSAVVGGYAVKAVNWLGRWSVLSSVVLALCVDQLSYQAGRRAAAKESISVVSQPMFAGITPLEAKVMEAQYLIMQQQKSDANESRIK